MQHRRQFLKNSGIIFTGLAFVPAASFSKEFMPGESFVSQRTAVKDRRLN